MNFDKYLKISKLTIFENDTLNLVAFLKLMWINRKILMYTVGFFIVLGLFYIVFSTKTYKSEVTLLPLSENSNSMGGLSSLAGLAGFNLNSSSSGPSTIPSEVYPEIIRSYSFLNEFIHQKFNFEDEPDAISVYDYAQSEKRNKGKSVILKYTIGLPSVIAGIFSKEGKGTFVEKDDYGVLNLSKEESAAFGMVSNIFEIDVDSKTGLINVVAVAEEPILAAQFAQKAVDLLQAYIIDYKTKQTRDNVTFIQARYDEKKKEYEAYEKKYYEYKDKHRNIISERINPEFQQLSVEYNIATDIYKSLAQQLEQAKISVKEHTPAFEIIEPAKIPKRKDSPHSKVILLVCVFMGFFISVVYIVIVNQFFYTKSEV